MNSAVDIVKSFKGCRRGVCISPSASADFPSWQSFVYMLSNATSNLQEFTTPLYELQLP